MHFSFLASIFAFLIIGGNCFKIETQFLEPLKNITAPIGSNLEFSCSVLHLSNYRIAWFFRPNEKTPDVIIALNSLAVTRNPRMSFSLIPRSGDITESILYIYNTRPEDSGTYSCGINMDPMILQKGTLDVREVTTQTPPKTTTTTTHQPLSVGLWTTDGTSEAICFNIRQFWNGTKTEAKKIWVGTREEVRKLEKYVESLWNRLVSWF